MFVEFVGLFRYLVVNVMGPGQGVHVEKLDNTWTNGLNDTKQTSGCLNCKGPFGGPHLDQESPSMYKTAAGKYVVLLAGATCFGVPQPDSGKWGTNGLPVGPANQRWGGTGVFVYVADKPLGPYAYHGDINNAHGGLNATSCTVCMGNPCPLGKCVLPIQLNSIVRDHSGTPLALTGGMWALNSANQTTNILGDYAEYWQPWSDVVDAAGLPKQLTYLDHFALTLPSVHRQIEMETPSVQFRASEVVLPLKSDETKGERAKTERTVAGPLLDAVKDFRLISDAFCSGDHSKPLVSGVTTVAACAAAVRASFRASFYDSWHAFQEQFVK